MPKHSIAVMGWGLWDGHGKPSTGGSAVTYELTRRLSKYFECEMIFETSDQRKNGKIEDANTGFTKRFILRPEGFWRLDDEFLQRYDLIHIWDRVPVFTYRACSEIFVPHCCTLHSAASMTDWIRIASAFYVPEHDMVVLGSKSLAYALTRFWKAPIDVIPYGVDTAMFKPMNKGDCRERLNIPKDSFILGYLGRPAKLDFILAYNTLRKVRKATGRGDVILLVAGGNYKVEPVYVTDDFIYVGYLNKFDIPIMLNSCDIFFNPVAGVQEGVGLTVIEAMACALPIVTTSWNGYKDTVTGDVGFLAGTCWKDGDVWINQDDLVSACVNLIEDEDLRDSYGQGARKRVEQKYRWEYCVEKYRERFLDTIQKSPPEEVPFRDASEKLHVCINGEDRVYSLEEAFRKIDKLRVSFQELFEGFISSRKTYGCGWRKFVCKDNILTLPKYREYMKKSLIMYEKRLKRRFPRLLNALKN